jgi:hypothetical protein
VTLACITNDPGMVAVRSCTIPGEHGDFCDGGEYRSIIVYDQTTRQDVHQLRWTGRACRGCLPRQAEHGLLCWHCWEKVLDALRMALDMISHLRSIETAQQLDNQGVRGSSSWNLPVPATWRAADELLILLGHPTPGFPSDANVFEVDAITERTLDALNPELWVSSKDGAMDAVRFYLAMQRATHAHPMREYEHRIRNVRCHQCRQYSLLWKPPLEHHDDIHVECTNPKCGAMVDQTLYERMEAIDLALHFTSSGAARRAAADEPEKKES